MFLNRGFFPLQLLVFKWHNSYALKDIKRYTAKRCKARNKTECTAGLYNRQMKPSTTGMYSQKPHAVDDLCMDRLHGSPRKYLTNFSARSTCLVHDLVQIQNSSVEHCCHRYMVLVRPCVRDRRDSPM